MKKPGTYTGVPYCRTANTKENRLLGPGIYEINQGDFTDRSIRAKTSGPNWKAAFDSSQLAAFPRMLYREQWEQKIQLSQQLGPGRYKIKDFIEDKENRPSSKGICETLAPRFPHDRSMMVPGVGTYGKGGIPSAVIEEKTQEPVCMTSQMESSCGRNDNIKHQGSGLTPGCYSYVSSIQNVLNKKIGNRGPYDLYSLKRIPNEKPMARVGQNFYEIKSFTNDLSDNNHKMHGKFSKYSKYPTPPTERICHSTLSQCPRSKDQPGPGYYEYFIRERIGSAPSKFPFNSSAKRMKKTQFDPIGPGQYNIDKWSKHQDVNGCFSVFESNTPQFINKNSPQYKLLRERLYPKHIHEEQHLVIIPLEAPC
jgi:hypothetical protein